MWSWMYLSCFIFTYLFHPIPDSKTVYSGGGQGGL